ncbi:carbohydrate ABC transporter permease [Ruminiclostridium cellobioparum]|uniref:ABC-type sugar transport system, permease component n=1 Tax=Ruminiclostridium cellobioparum subsp. termitidis CT1112 TaxID=1195236 RepID=S0FNZ4_RUMCE|nr:carbohydrate ABC transporter permease [Ruminiclostridium cellobioparum]EMS70193.1 ABC-type sugar transport system, permease component [Ruminiclostridium cellobioparum subsp. termitidis CT1112]
MNRTYYKNGIGGNIFDAANTLFMILFAFLMVYPFINLLAVSLNDGIDAAKGGIYFWPRKFSLESYSYMLQNKNLLKGAVISVLRVVAGTVTCLLGTGLLSYVVSVRNFSGRRFMRVIFIITMYFSGGLIPTYLLILKLHLINSFNVYWIPHILNAYYMLIIASYVQDIPEALSESASMDGAGDLRIFFQIIAPISLPVFACIAIYVGVSQWNSWFDVQLYNSNRKWDNLQIMLNRLLNEVQGEQELRDAQLQYQKFRNMSTVTLRAATTILVTMPIVFIYPFFQKYFIGGITIGAVKG